MHKVSYCISFSEVFLLCFVINAHTYNYVIMILLVLWLYILWFVSTYCSTIQETYSTRDRRIGPALFG